MVNKKLLALTALSVVMISAVAIKPAMAYFTDRTEATGVVPVSIGNTPTKATETVENMIKTISIQNTGSYEAFIRVTAIYGDNCTVEMGDCTGWKDGGDGYYYYETPLAKGATASDLKLVVTPKDGVTDDFNVIITQEATQVHYDSTGKAYSAWDKETSSTEQTTNSNVDAGPTDTTANSQAVGGTN